MKPKRMPPQPRLPVLSRMEQPRPQPPSWAERFEKSFVVQILRALGSVTIIFAFVGFLFTLIDRPQKQAIDAWTILLSDRPGNTGKSDALSTLVALDQSIRSVVVRRLADGTGAVRDKYCFQDAAATDASPVTPDITRYDGDLLYLRDVDLRGADARGLNAEASDLTGADFRDAQLQSASLFNADLTNADFTGARFFRTCLAAAELSGANFQSARLVSSTFYFAGSHAPVEDGKRALDPVDFTNAEILGSDLRFFGDVKVDFDGACIKNSEISVDSSARFSNAVLTGTSVLLRDNSRNFGDLENAYFDDSSVVQVETASRWLPAVRPAELGEKPTLAYISLAGSTFLRIDLADWKLQNADLSRTRFTNVDFAGAAFDGVEVSGADFLAPVAHYTRTCGGEEVSGPFIPEAERARSLVTRLAEGHSDLGGSDPAGAGTTRPSQQQLAGMWAWDDDPPKGLQEGARVGRSCPASMRPIYEQRQRFGLPLGCE